MKARIKFRKSGVMKYIGHLDLMRYFQKLMRRADIPIAFSQGFSPHMIMSFAQPLGVGVTSDGEYLDIELQKPISSKEAIDRMNQFNVPGIEICGFVQISDLKKDSGMTITKYADYHVFLLESEKSSYLRKEIPSDWNELVKQFLSQQEILVLKKTKKSEKMVDIKPMIYDMKIDGDAIYMLLATGSEHNIKPYLVMEAFCEYTGVQDAAFHYHRLDVYSSKGTNSSDVYQDIISLLDLGEVING